MPNDPPDVFTEIAGASSRNAPAPLPSSRRKEVVSLYVVTLGAFAVGLWCFYPYFVRELQRLERWQAVLIWSGDIASLAFFTFFVYRHSLLGQPLQDRPWDEFKRERVWQVALLGFLFATGLDLAITLGLMYEDSTLFATADIVAGQVERVVRYSDEQPVYVLLCRYQDKQGQWHTSDFMVNLLPANAPPRPGLPAPLVQAIQQGQVPFPVQISCDPAWPARSWLTDYGWDDGNRLHYFSLILLGFQIGGLFLFAVVGETASKNLPLAPWWIELHQVIPFLGQVFFMIVAGPFYRAKLWSLNL
jgi:hypothetical protein